MSPLDEFTEVVSACLELVGERRKAWLRPGGERAKTASRHESAATENEQAAAEEIRDWVKRLSDENIADAFNRLRRLTLDFYDRTIAYVTIHTLIVEACDRLELLAEDATDDDAACLIAISELFALIDMDAEIFQAVNRSDAGEAVAAARRARGAVIKIHADVNGLAHPLAPELHTETAMLELYYRGLLEGAAVVKAYEEALDRHYQQSDDNRLRLDASACVGAAKRIGRRIEEIGALGPEPDTVLANVVLSCGSRLSAWVDVLEAMAHAFEVHTRVLRLSTVELVYCYPFAVTLDAKRRAESERELREAARGLTPGDSLDGLRASLRDLCKLGKDGPEVDPLTRSELWAGSGDVVYNGASLSLGTLREIDNPAGPDSAGDSDRTRRLEARLKLSLLGNHCLCLHRTLEDPTPAELFRALRAGGDYALDREYRYQAGNVGDGSRWRNLHGFACDVIQLAADELAGSHGESDGALYWRGDVHVIAVVRTEDHDRGGTEMADRLERAYGGRILRANTHRVASALNEWTRYPISPHTTLKVAELGHRDDWLSSTDDATLFLVVGNPSWRTEAYVEAAQFAASSSAQLLLWGREVFHALDRDRSTVPEDADAAELRKLRDLQLDAQRFTTAITAQALCWSRAHRHLVDDLLETTGTQAIAGDLHSRLNALELVLDKQDREQREEAERARSDQRDEDRQRRDEAERAHNAERAKRERADRTRNGLLYVLAVFGVLNLASALDLHSTGQEVAQWALFALVLMLSLGLILGRHPIQKVKEWPDELRKWWHDGSDSDAPPDEEGSPP